MRVHYDVYFWCIMFRVVFGLLLLFAVDAWIREGGFSRFLKKRRIRKAAALRHKELRESHPAWWHARKNRA